MSNQSGPYLRYCLPSDLHFELQRSTMSSTRPKKRPRQERDYADHDSISLDDDYYTVHHREGRLKRVGNSSLTAILPRDIVDNASKFWTSFAFWTPPDDFEFALDPDGRLYSRELDSDVMEKSPPNPKPERKKRSKVSKRPHIVWMELHRQTYLDELLRWAGRGDASTTTTCPDCLARSVDIPSPGEYRCKECFYPDLTCASCCRWSNARFTDVSLKSLGLKIQLNHAGSYCPEPVPCHSSMLVLHTNGIHEIDIQYCGCARSRPHHIQLLRRRLYPSSQLIVKNCCTFELLRHLHYLSLTTKASTYDFYRALEKETNNTGVNVPKSRYKALMRTVLQWRHLKMLLWAGRGNHPDGVEGTQPGELGLRCPSCPWPGVNLNDDWENASDETKFLYTMMICMDANFRLKNQLVSNYSQDPGLGIGWAYMVPRKPYENYLLTQANESDVSTCVGFQALAKANSKFSVGLRYTGVNAVVCGRSEMILPVGVGNLPKGERYSSMDYIFGSVLRYVMVAVVLVSYDIACQWFVHLFSRMERDWPEEIKVTRPIHFVPAIPKLHYAMHETTGHHVYSLNYMPGAGLSDCECPERVWAPHNALGNSTKTQAPGSRQDVLDDHFGFWNWLKYVGMGETLSRKYRAAVAERNVQAEGHRGLTAVLDPKVSGLWERMCVSWEQDSYPKTKKRDPYHVEEGTISEARVKKDLAAEEEKRLRAGGVSLNKTSPASFIGLGLEIEETQRRIQRLADGLSTHSTDTREGSLTEQRNVLRNRLRIWDQLVPLYMPGLFQFLADRADNEQPSTSGPNDNTEQASAQSPHPEYFDVWLPSRIPVGERSKVCREGLSDIEDRLRYGQCHDALESLRQVLRLKSRMIQFKNQNIRGQREGTRSRAVIDRIHDRAKVAASKYRAARKALFSLRGPGDWEATLKILEDGDIRGYQDPNRLERKPRKGIFEDDEMPSTSSVGPTEFSLFNDSRTRRDGTGETHRTISWIWVNACTSQPGDENDDVLRSEWAKSRARAERAREEVMLLKEEMRRVLAFLEWKAEWWKGRVAMRSDISSDLAEGIQAFALTQVDVQDLLAAHFRRLWEVPLGLVQEQASDKNNDVDDDSSDDEGEGEGINEGTVENYDNDEDEPILP